jgi:hypothetical protein
MPVIMLLVRSWEGLLAPAATATAIPAAAAMVIPRVHQVERRLASLTQMIGHQGHLADQVAGDQHRAALGGQ